MGWQNPDSRWSSFSKHRQKSGVKIHIQVCLTKLSVALWQQTGFQMVFQHTESGSCFTLSLPVTVTFFSHLIQMSKPVLLRTGASKQLEVHKIGARIHTQKTATTKWRSLARTLRLRLQSTPGALMSGEMGVGSCKDTQQCSALNCTKHSIPEDLIDQKRGRRNFQMDPK